MSELLEQPIHCPYCGEPITVLVDTSEPSQRYIEDCQVCCRPIHLEVSLDSDGLPALTARHENE